MIYTCSQVSKFLFNEVIIPSSEPPHQVMYPNTLLCNIILQLCLTETSVSFPIQLYLTTLSNHDHHTPTTPSILLHFHQLSFRDPNVKRRITTDLRSAIAIC